MIEFYTGTPGSGKSYHIAKTIDEALRKGKNVISNVNIDISKIVSRQNRELGVFIYLSNDEILNKNYFNRGICGDIKMSKDRSLYVDSLYNFAYLFHAHDAKGKMIEHQTLVVLDECQELFNPRTWNRYDRLKWCKFMRIHRHLGYDVILSSQDDKAVDKQMRATFQTEVLHRKLSNYKLLGKIMAFPFGGNLFICIEKMYGMSKKDSHIKSYLLFGSSRYFDLYDSYNII